MNRLFAILVLIAVSALVHAQSWTQAELDRANTAANVSILTQEEKNVIMYCNLARMFPKRYAEIELKDYRRTSNEQSLIRDLNSMSPVGPLRHSDEMYPYAKCWAVESGKLGITGHNRRTCADMPAPYGENCHYGYTRGQDIIRDLLIDEGVPSLGHRKNCLNAQFTLLGTYIAPHNGYRYCCVMDFTYKTGYSDSYTPSLYSSTSSYSSYNSNTPSNFSSSSSTSSVSSSSTQSKPSKKRVEGTTPRERFYSYAGAKHTSFISAGYAYSFKKELRLANASLFDFRYKQFGMSLLNAEMGVNPWSKWIGYNPSLKVYIPVACWMAVAINAGAAADASITKTSVDENFDYDIKDDIFISACGGFSLYFVPVRYTPVELKLEYRHDIYNESPVSGLVFGAVLHIGR